MVGLLIAFPQMSLVYKSGRPSRPSKVKIEIPPTSRRRPDDILKDLQKGGAPRRRSAGDEPGKTPRKGGGGHREGAAGREMKRPAEAGLFGPDRDLRPT
jgi:hypothetical protein